MSERRARLPALALGLVAACTGGQAFSDEGSAPARLHGAVSGPRGLPVSGATIEVSREPPAGRTRARTSSGSMGGFVVDGLAAGRYQVSVEAAGFAPWHGVVDVAAGSPAHLDVRLVLAGIRETVNVVAWAPSESLEAGALCESRSDDLGEALSRLSGATRRRRGAIGSDVGLGGFPGQDVAILVDGVRVCGACPSRMDPPTFHVDFAEVERVDVSRGPFDVRNAGGLGGTIEVVTRRPAPGWHVTPTLALSSFGQLNPSLSASYGGGHVAALAGASYREAGPYRDGNGKAFTEHGQYRSEARDSDAFRAAAAFGRVMHHDENGLLQIAYARQWSGRGLYPALAMDARRDDGDRVQAAFEGVHLRVQVGASRVVHDMDDALRSSSLSAPRAYSMSTGAESRTLGGRLEWSTLTWRAGVEAGHRVWAATTELAAFAYQPQRSLAEATTDSLGAYFQGERDLGLRVTLQAGVRLDTYHTRSLDTAENTALFRAFLGEALLSRSDRLPAASLALTWRAHSLLTVSASAGHAARVPEPNERYLALRRAGSDWIGRPDLRPARNTGVDLRLRLAHPRLRAELAVNANRVTDFVTVVSLARLPGAPAGEPEARGFANVDATLIGAQTRASWTVRSSLFVDADASWVRGTQTPDAGLGVTSSRLPEMPPPRLRSGLRYDDGRAWARIEGRWAARQRRTNSDLDEAETPGYGVLDVSAGVRLRHWRVSAGMSNVFDRYYADHLSYQRDPFRSGFRLPEPGRTLFLTLAASY
jgi:iron complex outermembrane recepter protein